MDKGETERMETYGHVPHKGGDDMHFIKIFILIVLSLAIGIFACAKEQKMEAPKQERITKNLVPPKSELKGQNFLVEISDLQVVMDVDIASKEIIETPSLKGHIKITNKSPDILDIQAVTLEYSDEAGKPIPFKSGEKIATASLFLKALRPGEITEGSLDVTIPRMAVKEKALGRIEINLVYVPSPLRRETLTLSEKVE
ncbi:MAG: hypothetical protein ACUVWO_15885 [Thermodesulfobacteriota bacterium]